MKSNRRSVLIGLGALTVGGGAVFGTGAFSSVEANRNVSIATTGDDTALLQITVNDDYEGVNASNETSVIEFNFDNLNDDAKTTFDGAIVVTPDANAGEGTDPEWEITADVIDGGDALTVDDNGGIVVGPDDPAEIDVVIDLITGSEADVDENTQISIEAIAQ